VDIGLEKKGFLYIKDVRSSPLDEDIEGLNGHGSKPDHPVDLKKGDEVLVQVVKEPFSTKGARLTTHLSIPGKYLVLMSDKTGVGISRKIEDPAERNRLRQNIQKINLPKDVGFILRTAAIGKQEKDFIRDVNFLNAVWRRIKALSTRRSAPALIYEEYDLPLRAIRDVSADDLDRIVVDDKYYYKNILRFVRTYMPHLARRVYFARDEMPLFEKEQIESKIQDLYEPKVWLKSGAYIIIEPTEGLVVIDVNSGRFKGKKEQEETALAVNLEAAKEIARQLRLRDLGGLIVIDFIDMARDSNRRKLINAFKNYLSTDRAKTEVMGISRFGILEMARQRIRRTLESIYYQNCPHCKGRGKIMSPLTVSAHVLRELKQYLSAHHKSNVVTVRLHPQIKATLDHSYAHTLLSLQRHFHKKIELLPDASLNQEDTLIS
jgi:ribonuclease G